MKKNFFETLQVNRLVEKEEEHLAYLFYRLVENNRIEKPFLYQLKP
jgi:hypothetical protein